MKRYLQHYLILFLLMGCIGITVEIFFTAIYDLIKNPEVRDLRLMGKTYIWMFPIYGLTALTFPPLIIFLDKFMWWGRALLKGIGILVIEYIAGALLEYFTGTCPWKYQEGWHIHGYIRLDYYPFWVAFAFGVEKVIVWLHPRVSLLKKAEVGMVDIPTS